MVQHFWWFLLLYECWWLTNACLRHTWVHSSGLMWLSFESMWHHHFPLPFFSSSCISWLIKFQHHPRGSSGQVASTCLSPPGPSALTSSQSLEPMYSAYCLSLKHTHPLSPLLPELSNSSFLQRWAASYRVFFSQSILLSQRDHFKSQSWSYPSSASNELTVLCVLLPVHLCEHIFAVSSLTLWTGAVRVFACSVFLHAFVSVTTLSTLPHLLLPAHFFLSFKTHLPPGSFPKVSLG